VGGRRRRRTALAQLAVHDKKEGFILLDHPQVGARPLLDGVEAGLQANDLFRQHPVALRELLVAGGLGLDLSLEPGFLGEAALSEPQPVLQTEQHHSKNDHQPTHSGTAQLLFGDFIVAGKVRQEAADEQQLLKNGSPLTAEAARCPKWMRQRGKEQHVNTCAQPMPGSRDPGIRGQCPEYGASVPDTENLTGETLRAPGREPERPVRTRYATGGCTWRPGQSGTASRSCSAPPQWRRPGRQWWCPRSPRT